MLRPASLDLEDTPIFYTAHTETGDTFDIEFRGEHTEDSVRVHQLLTTVLSVANDLKIVGTISNEDILQALVWHRRDAEWFTHLNDHALS